VSWGWKPDRSRLDECDEFGSTPRLRLFELEGTRDPCPWLAVLAAIDFQANLGWDAIRGRITELVRHVRKQLGGELGLEPVTPTHPALHGAMTAFRLPPGIDAQEVRRQLWEDRIEAPIIERSDGLLIRVSTHFYNTEEDLNRLAVALRRLCRS
jgi:isopenicillin-N epimerase